MQVEGKLLQLKKEHSMLDCDYKQAKQKLDELQAQKEKLSEEVRPVVAYSEVTVVSFTPPSNQNITLTARIALRHLLATWSRLADSVQACTAEAQPRQCRRANVFF